jgi:hypothetical protein
MSLIIQYGSGFIDMKELQNLKDPMAVVEKMGEFIVPMLVLCVVSLFLSNILHYYILFKPLDNSKNIFVSVVGSLKYFIPYLIIIVLLGLFGSVVISLGILAFGVGVIFSVIYLMMISFFVLPVMMTEGNSIGNAIIRTATLSHRNFWNNIGWSSVFLILFVVISILLSTVIMIPFTGGFVKTIINPGTASQVADVAKSPLFIILSAAVNALTLPLIPIFGFILYFSSRAGEVPVRDPSYGDTDYKVRVEDLYAKPIHEDKSEQKENNE